MTGTLNIRSNAGKVWVGPILSPDYADLGIGWEYSVVVFNTTAEDITSGVIEFENADADPNNPCAPDEWFPIDPISDCGPIVTGVPYTPPVTITITPERPIRARASCQYAVSCPRQFIRVSAAPAGTWVAVVITRLKRTDFSHLGPFGGIPAPLPLAGSAFQAQFTQPQQQAAETTPRRRRRSEEAAT